MNIITLSYSESHEQFSEYGLKLWKKAGIEAELSEGDDPGKSYDELEKIVKARLTENPPPVIIPTSQVEKPEELTVSVIESCPDLPALESYRLLVIKDKTLKEAYDARFELLKNK